MRIRNASEFEYIIKKHNGKNNINNIKHIKHSLIQITEKEKLI